MCYRFIFKPSSSHRRHLWKIGIEGKQKRCCAERAPKDVRALFEDPIPAIKPMAKIAMFQDDQMRSKMKHLLQELKHIKASVKLSLNRNYY
jgi:hypothetical protein